MSNNSEWRVSRWNSHNEDSVVVDDDQSFSGLRLIAECDTPETARIVAAAREMLAALESLPSWQKNVTVRRAIAKARGTQS